MPRSTSRRALTTLLASSALPCTAVEQTIRYPAVATGRRDRLVEAMMHDHQELTERSRELANVHQPFAALAVVEGTAAMFALHGGRETKLLIPTLATALST